MFSKCLTKGLVLTATVAVTCLTSLQSLAGDGRNGPQLSGNAIPVHVDRALTVEELSQVAGSCDFKLLKKLYAQIYKEEPNDLIMIPVSLQPGGPEGNALFTQDEFGPQTILGTSRIVQKKNYKGGAAVQLYATTYASYFSALGVYGWVSLNKINDPNRIAPYSETMLRPHFAFDQLITEQKYSELQELIAEKKVIKNLKIVLPSTGLQPITKLFNLTTNREVPIQINVKEYAQCLLSGIQKD